MFNYTYSTSHCNSKYYQAHVTTNIFLTITKQYLTVFCQCQLLPTKMVILGNLQPVNPLGAENFLGIRSAGSFYILVFEVF